MDLRENQFIKFPIKLEQYLMEGTYRKVEEAQKGVPAESYTFFVSKLSGTVRDSIADRYGSLPRKLVPFELTALRRKTPECLCPMPLKSVKRVIR